MATEAAPWSVENDLMHLLTNYTLNFMADNVKREQPFFIWLSYLYPHTPYEVPEPYFSLYKDVTLPPLRVEKEGLMAANKPFRQVFHQENNDRLLPFDDKQVDAMRKTYYGMVTLVDDEVKRITDFLQANHLAGNTIIIFTSDHGDYQGDHGMFTKSPALYDCLVRVPLIFSWPGTIAGNVRSDQLISQVDIMPTLFSYDENLLLKNMGKTTIENSAINTEYRKSIDIWLDKTNWEKFASEIRNKTTDTLNIIIGKHHSRRAIDGSGKDQTDLVRLYRTMKSRMTRSL